jgi:hypothetical protein
VDPATLLFLDCSKPNKGESSRITHLYFADDLMIFCRGETHSASLVKFLPFLSSLFYFILFIIIIIIILIFFIK